MIKARRSVLYLPADKPRVLQKAMQLDADCLIFDLEDAVAPSNKTLAREQLLKALAENDYGFREKIVRVNGLDTEWGAEDVRSLAASNADALLLPKVESLHMLDELADLADQHGKGMRVWAMVETAKGVQNVDEYAEFDRLDVLVMGTNDLAKELQVPQTLERTGFLYSLSRSVLAARVNKLDIIDGVYIHFRDQQGLQASCMQGKELGFNGKTLIHPDQIEICNSVFSPSDEEVKEAADMLNAWQQAEQQGKGVVEINGRLVEELHIEQARRCLDMHQAIKNR